MEYHITRLYFSIQRVQLGYKPRNKYVVAEFLDLRQISRKTAFFGIPIDFKIYRESEKTVDNKNVVLQKSLLCFFSSIIFTRSTFKVFYSNIFRKTTSIRYIYLTKFFSIKTTPYGLKTQVLTHRGRQ